jgi:hypothetical protein
MDCDGIDGPGKLVDEYVDGLMRWLTGNTENRGGFLGSIETFWGSQNVRERRATCTAMACTC